MTIFSIVGGLIGWLVITTLVVKLVGGWFSAEPFGLIRAFLAELAFMFMFVVLQVGLLLAFNVLGLNVDLKTGMLVVEWAAIGLIDFVFTIGLGASLFTMILPMGFSTGLWAWFFSHFVVVTVLYVGVISMTDFRPHIPIKQAPIEVQSADTSTDDYDQSLVSSQPVEIKEEEPEKTFTIVHRKGYEPINVSQARSYINKSIRYRLPNGTINQGILLSVRNGRMKIKQSAGGGNIIYTVILKRVKKLEVYGTWEEEVYR